MPGTAKITELVLSGTGMMRHTDGRYYQGKPLFGQAVDTEVQKVLAFIKLLKAEAEAYYASDTSFQANYEDMHYLAAQIRDSQTGDHDNPAIRQFIEKIGSESKALAEGKGLWRLAGETTNYIKGVVCSCLAEAPAKNAQGLGCIIDACQEDQAQIDLFTLNHDLLLESALAAGAADYEDGFSGKKTGDIRRWAPTGFDGRARVRLFKLHGSVDWFRLRPVVGGDWFTETVARIKPKFDIDHADMDGRQVERVEVLPLILAGTFDKIHYYASGIFAELHFRFYESLRQADRLVVCGYGFRDKGINNQIINWVFSAPENRRLIVIHGQPAELKTAARGAIRNNWDEWERRQILRVIPEWIECVNWSTIKATL